MDTPCKNCGFNTYELIDGHYYCDECHEQLENIIDLVKDEDVEFIDIKGGVKQKDAKKSIKANQSIIESKCTSFEEYNYILRGLVDEILMIEDIPNFKKTVLQLWITFLKYNEIAFFDNLGNLPKFSAKFRYQDAQILYSKKPKKKKKYPKQRPFKQIKIEGDSIEDRKLRKRSSRKSLKKIQKINDEADESCISSNTSTLTNLTLEDIEATMITQELNIEFSQPAKNFKQKYTKYADERNLKVKLDEDGQVIPGKIDAFLHHNILVLSGRTMLVILICALNICGSKIQLTDLLRFAREGYISYYNIKRLLPEKLEDVRLSLEKYHTFCYNTYRTMHMYVQNFFYHFPEIRASLKPPNMAILVRRYIEDLNLPLCLIEYVEKLVDLLPPKFKSHANTSPFYEGRAMGYILFVLKLLFGIDGYREKEISKSTKIINSKLNELNAPQKLFDYEAWREYIEYREIILNKYYYPSVFNSEYKLDRPYENFVSMLDNVEPMTFKTYLSEGKMHKSLQEHIHRKNVTKQVVQKLLNLHDESPTKNLKFNCSFTPLKDALQVILNSPLEAEINTRILKDFSNDTLDFYFDPDKLVEFFSEHEVKIGTKKSTFPKNFSFQKGLNRNVIPKAAINKFNVSHDTIEAKKWISNIVKGFNDSLKDEVERKVTYHHNTMSKVLKNRRQLREIVKNNEQKKIEQEKSISNQDIAFDEIVCHENSSYRCGKSKEREKLTFIHPDFNLWHRKVNVNPYGNLTLDHPDIVKLPKSFSWLLKAASHVVGHGHHFVFFHEMLIENEFVKVYKPLEMTDNKLEFRVDEKKLAHTLHAYW